MERFEKQSELTFANKKDYLKLHAGIVKISELQDFLASSHLNSFINKDKKLIFYRQNRKLVYTPPQLGETWGSYLEDSKLQGMYQEMFEQLESNPQDEILLADEDNTKTQFIVSRYQASKTKEGKFNGILEEREDIYPLVQLYLQKTGQKLVDDENNPNSLPETDADTGASEMWT
ncbi:oxidoreductase [Lactobacillus sp. PV037]|uniref:PAS domain-containing protein n=1 Tax=unclassified Lactobacillus TaxID=2620435 RepID=UPI00223F301B|nr:MULTISPECIES: PAS domain-containing protein [unclassified Lactobacillus]QNQ82728.1 oxidoreductase [Lactobacillus sp. PV012]QNQ83153.1 oxidoreductase [Lactobacillus sp. PV037]